jgi:hypothetical protein
MRDGNGIKCPTFADYLILAGGVGEKRRRLTNGDQQMVLVYLDTVNDEEMIAFS